MFNGNIRKRVCKYLIRLKRGDKCLNEFIDTAHYYVQGVVSAYLYDRSYVDDAVVNTFNRIIDKISLYDGSDKGLAWVCKIAQNEARRINAKLPCNVVNLDEIACVDELCAPRTDREAIVDLYTALDTLDFVSRKLVIFKAILGMSYKEISAELGLPISTVHYRVKNSLAKLRTFLTDC